MPARQMELLEKPKRMRRVMMHVADAGEGVIRLKCSKCGFDTGWIEWDRKLDSVSKMKRGLPCPRCTDACHFDRGLPCTCGGAHTM